MAGMQGRLAIQWLQTAVGVTKALSSSQTQQLQGRYCSVDWSAAPLLGRIFLSSYFNPPSHLFV